MSVMDDAALERIQGAIEDGSLLEASSLEELAQQMEVPADALTATVERYNELVSMGEDLDFGKIPERLTAIDEPPFYAGKIPVLLLVTLGGLDVNTQLQVLDKERNVIPGLYAAGNVKFSKDKRADDDRNTAGWGGNNIYTGDSWDTTNWECPTLLYNGKANPGWSARSTKDTVLYWWE